jgi:hypothetical protein
MQFLLNPQGYAFHIDDNLTINREILLANDCTFFPTQASMVDAIAAENAFSPDEIEGALYDVKLDDEGRPIHRCDRGVDTLIEGSVEAYLIDYVL